MHHIYSDTSPIHNTPTPPSLDMIPTLSIPSQFPRNTPLTLSGAVLLCFSIGLLGLATRATGFSNGAIPSSSSISIIEGRLEISSLCSPPFCPCAPIGLPNNEGTSDGFLAVLRCPSHARASICWWEAMASLGVSLLMRVWCGAMFSTGGSRSK